MEGLCPAQCVPLPLRAVPLAPQQGAQVWFQPCQPWRSAVVACLFVSVQVFVRRARHTQGCTCLPTCSCMFV